MPTRPSNWVNLQDYLDLNRESGEEMGGRVVANVGQQASGAGQAVDSAGKLFDLRSMQGTLMGPSGSGEENGHRYTADDARAKAEQGYSGPNSLADVNEKLYGQVADAVSKVKAAQDPNQQAGVIREAYGNQVASGTGGSMLDTFLMGQTSGAALSGLGDQYGGLMDTLGLAEKKAGDTAKKNTATSKASASAWGAMVPGLEEEALRQMEAKAAGERAMAELQFQIDYQQEQQYGHGNSYGRGGVTDSAHQIDPRELAYMQGNGAEYDAAHPAQPWDYAADWGGNLPQNGGDWPNADRGRPKPYGAERSAVYDIRRQRAGTLGKGNY